jgi:protein TonB
MARGIAIPFLAGAFFLAVVCLVAEHPLRLDTTLDKARESETVAIELPKPPEQKAPEPEPQAPQEDPLAALAPEALSANPSLMDSGFGAGYGAGGPGTGSASGLGGGAAALVNDKTSVDRNARVVFRAPLEYPSSARSKGVTGEVLLRLRIGEGGAVEEVQIARAEPSGIFEEAAQKAVRSWRFEPAFVKGRTVASWISQKIRFEMN